MKDRKRQELRHMTLRPRKTPSIATVQAILGCATVALLGGCQLVFGDFDVIDSSGSGGSAGTGGTGSGGGTATSCAPGITFTCKLNVLIECGTGKQTTCGNEFLCRPTEGRCRACSSGDTQCVGNVLALCNTDFSGFDLANGTNCAANNQVCDPALKKCTNCLSGQKTCKDTSLITCNDTGDTITTRDCSSDYNPPQCITDSVVLAHCYQCDVPFVAVCSNNTILKTCSPDHSIHTEACPTPTSCITPTDGTAAYCQ